MKQGSVILKSFLWLTFLLLLSACATTVSYDCAGEACGGDGSPIAGKAGLSGGSATYSIDVVVPPGRDDMSPGVSISYASNSGSSVLGMGWSLGEGGSMFRCAATLAIDGYAQGARMRPDDKLCLNGMRLVVVKGDYGKSGAVYRQADENFARITEHGDIGDPDSYFVVDYKNGIIAYYRTPLAGTGGTAPVYWRLTREEDRVGNIITYAYIRPTPGEIEVSQIRYTGRDIGGKLIQGTRWVRFRYEDRPDRSSDYLAGRGFYTTRRLAAIETGLDAQDPSGASRLVRRYRFHYTQSRSTGRSLLTQIDECAYAADGRSACREPTVITWLDRPLDYMPPVRYEVPSLLDTYRSAWSPAARPAGIAPIAAASDFNGSGRRWLRFYKAGAPPSLLRVDIAGKLVDSYALRKYVPQPDPAWARLLGRDFFNVGAASIVGDAGGRLTATRWTGAGLGSPQVSSIPFGHDMLVEDFDGDGQSDVMEGSLERGRYRVVLYRGAGSSPDGLKFSNPVDVLDVAGAHLGANSLHLKAVGDLDGNGTSDALVMRGDVIEQVILPYQEAGGRLRFQVASARSYGIVGPEHRGKLYFADINGDGLNDIVYSAAGTTGVGTLHYQVNTGAGFAPPVDTGVQDPRTTGTARASTIVDDIDTDGRDELLFPARLLVDYCLPSGAVGADGKTAYACSSDGLADSRPRFDYGIYSFDVLDFVQQPDGSLRPVVRSEANIVAQANLASAGDLQGDGIDDLVSPFDRWFSNARFRAADGGLVMCPQPYGCGLHVASSADTRPLTRRDALPDTVKRIDDGAGKVDAWTYYPLSNPKRALYSVPAVGSPRRFINVNNFYFRSSMYVVGEMEETGDQGYDLKMAYGDAVYNNEGRGMAGFRWIAQTYPDANIKYVDWYSQSYPFWGTLLGEWKEHADVLGDDLVNGRPSPGYIDYSQYTWDCQGPKGAPSSVRHGCVDSGTPTYLVRKRVTVDTKRDWKTLQTESVDRYAYDYDLYGNRVREEEVKTEDGESTTTLVERRYAPPDLDGWWLGKLEQSKTTQAQGKGEPELQEMIDFAYNSRRQVTLRTEHKSATSKVTFAMKFAHDQSVTSPSFGNVDVIEFDVLDDKGKFVPVNQLVYSFTQDGYFHTAVQNFREGTTLFEYDPSTGALLKEVKPDGEVIRNEYDPFGQKIAGGQRKH